jgi:hypothetical protein
MKHRAARRIGFLLSITLSISLTGASRRDAESRQLLPRDHYRPVIALAVSYGSGLGEIGFTAGGDDQRPLGPLSFALDGDSLVVLDSVNQRVATFDRYGHLISTVEGVYGTDVAVMPDGVGVLNTATSTLVVHSRDGQQHEIEVSSAQTSLTVAVTRAVAYESDARVASASTAVAASPPVAVFGIDDHTGEIRIAGGVTIPVRTEETFGSIELVGVDRGGNIFVAVEQLLPGPTINVKKEVRKYSARGLLRALIPIEIDYAAHPRREFALDADGTLYHLRPLAQQLVIERWQQ